jgi:hypothetical protein
MSDRNLKKQMPVRFNPDEYDWLTAESIKSGHSIAGLVREAVGLLKAERAFTAQVRQHLESKGVNYPSQTMPAKGGVKATVDIT